MEKKYLLLACVTLFSQLHIYSKEQQSINLGDTPWKFSKVIRQETNLAKDASILYGLQKVSEINDDDIHTEWRADYSSEKHLFIDLHEKKQLKNFKLIFKGDQTRFATVKMEASLNNEDWYPMAEGTVKRACDLHKEGDISNVNNTVGYFEKVTYTYLSIPVSASYRYIRLTILSCQSEKNEELPKRISELAIYPVENNYSDQEIAGLAFKDDQWESVGIPHCFNERDTYLNASTGERCWRGEAWYRKKIGFSKKDRDKEIFLEFQGINFAAIVFINGQAIPGNTQVQHPGIVTHVGSALPFVVNITKYIKWNTENQIAIKVSNAKNTFFTWPEFGTNEGFGQAMGGIVCPIYMHKKHKIHIPFNRYSPLKKWGTYLGTVSATPQKATIRFQVNVDNTTDQEQDIELRTYLQDQQGHTVLSFSDKQKVSARTTQLFDHTESIQNPHLWYPIGCSGTPYLYTVLNKVYVNGKLADSQSEPFGIREITWDENYCYVNGEKCILRGFGSRNIYPGLGAAIPAALQWQDIALIAQCGGNTLRVGHQPPFTEALKACDAYGGLLIVNSGDGEWSLKNEPAKTYKREYDREMLVAFRNHPSVVIWESNNGLAYDGDKYLPSHTLSEVKAWDYIQPRLVLNRDGYPPEWDEKEPIVIGYTNRYEKVKGRPSLNTEVYGANWSGLPSWCIARFDYNNEKEFSMDYIRNYLDNLDNQACGWIDWMLVETYGEGYTIYLNGMKNQKSLGSCAMDGNRFPKLKYRIYQKALWVPYSQQPGVALQSHWNYSGIQNIDAWSNCPYVELFINKKSYGIVEPDQRTRQCTWRDIQWEPGTVEAVGLDTNKHPVCSEKIESSDKPYAIEVTIEKPAAKPTGEEFILKANASDAFIVTAKVVDKDGHWCPWAVNLLKFEVEGEGIYKGSYNFYVTEGKDLSYHAPGDTELQAEGGLMRVAVRTTFKPGKIKVKVSSDGLISGESIIKSKKIKH